MNGKRKGQAVGAPAGEQPPIEPTKFLIARAIEVEQSRKKKFGIKLRFKIRHIMWLSLWTAVVLAVREPLIASLPEVAAAIAMISVVLTIAMFITVFGIAILMDEGPTKDRVVLLLFYCMAGSSFVFVCLGLLAVAAQK
jgi:hypothetical protein